MRRISSLCGLAFAFLCGCESSTSPSDTGAQLSSARQNTVRVVVFQAVSAGTAVVTFKHYRSREGDSAADSAIRFPILVQESMFRPAPPP